MTDVPVQIFLIAEKLHLPVTGTLLKAVQERSIQNKTQAQSPTQSRRLKNKKNTVSKHSEYRLTSKRDHSRKLINIHSAITRQSPKALLPPPHSYTHTKNLPSGFRTVRTIKYTSFFFFFFFPVDQV